ncbi:translation initiation factor IF-2-like [Zalophus californianus]|uniref:Translation initiation factor IF-2-like n=1 Tax=Zalophus californianus TaxID=9704 RepID=A0A6J2E045_ZALCA|nr:translation initiation factor IF-2-like [Zalophus californianus]
MCTIAEASEPPTPNPLTPLGGRDCSPLIQQTFQQERSSGRGAVIVTTAVPHPCRGSPAHPTSSLLGPGPHLSACGTPEGCWRVEDTPRKSSLPGTGDTCTPGTSHLSSGSPREVPQVSVCMIRLAKLQQKLATHPSGVAGDAQQGLCLALAAARGVCPPPVASPPPPRRTHPQPPHAAPRLRRAGRTLPRAASPRPAGRPPTRTVSRARTCAPGRARVPPPPPPRSGPDARRPRRLTVPHLPPRHRRPAAARSPSPAPAASRPCLQRPCSARPRPHSPAPGAPGPRARPMGSARRARCESRRLGPGALPAARCQRGPGRSPPCAGDRPRSSAARRGAPSRPHGGARGARAAGWGCGRSGRAARPSRSSPGASCCAGGPAHAPLLRSRPQGQGRAGPSASAQRPAPWLGPTMSVIGCSPERGSYGTRYRNYPHRLSHQSVRPSWELSAQPTRPPSRAHPEISSGYFLRASVCRRTRPGADEAMVPPQHKRFRGDLSLLQQPSTGTAGLGSPSPEEAAPGAAVLKVDEREGAVEILSPKVMVLRCGP